MAWPPTNTDMIRNLDGASEWATATSDGHWFPGPGKGVAIYDPKYVEQLISDGMAEFYECPSVKHAARLTSKGKQAAEMLRGTRSTSDYSMPDWFLAELTK